MIKTSVAQSDEENRKNQSSECDDNDTSDAEGAGRKALSLGTLRNVWKTGMFIIVGAVVGTGSFSRLVDCLAMFCFAVTAVVNKVVVCCMAPDP